MHLSAGELAIIGVVAAFACFSGTLAGNFIFDFLRLIPIRARLDRLEQYVRDRQGDSGVAEAIWQELQDEEKGPE